MISYTPTFEAIMKQPEKTVRVRTYAVEETTAEIWANDLQNITIDSAGAFLSSSARMATLNIYGDQSPTIGAGIRVDLEALKTDHSWETITLGFFSVYQVEYNVETDISKVTLYDPILRLATIEYNIDDNVFPLTVKELAQRMAEISTTTLDPNFDNLPNADFIITQNLWATIQNTTFRDVVTQIAEATGTTAVVSGDTLLFKQYIAPTVGIDKTNLIKFRMGQPWGNVNSVSLSRMPQNDNILLRDDEDAEEHGIFEATIINNQIVDNDRQTLIQPLYDELVGETPYIMFYDSEFTTEGHGWYEVGDTVTATLNGIDYTIFITEHHLMIDGGISESMKSIVPTNPAVNKTTAGGVLKTLWNTEIKVDKQQNEITSVVEEQRIFEDQTEQNFTEIRQTIDQINVSIQDGGGINQINNSVGYSTDNGAINFWDAVGLTAKSRSDTSPFTAGSISGSTIDLNGGAGTFTQRVSTNPGGSYVISFFARKETQGVVTVSASNESDNFEVTFNDDTAYEWKKYRINDITSTSNYLDITFTIDADVELFSFTDLVMIRGIADKGWSQAVGEVANSNVTFDTKGITVKSNTTDRYTAITPQEFAGYDDRGQRAFYLNNDTTQVNNLRVGNADEDANNLDGYEGAIETPEILIISLSSGPNAGMNFVVKD